MLLMGSRNLQEKTMDDPLVGKNEVAEGIRYLRAIVPQNSLLQSLLDSETYAQLVPRMGRSMEGSSGKQILDDFKVSVKTKKLKPKKGGKFLSKMKAGKKILLSNHNNYWNSHTENHYYFP